LPNLEKRSRTVGGGVDQQSHLDQAEYDQFIFERRFNHAHFNCSRQKQRPIIVSGIMDIN